MPENLLEVINPEDLDFIETLADRFNKEFRPKNHLEDFICSQINLDWHNATENCYRNRPFRHLRWPLLNDSDFLYLLGTIFRFIGYGASDESYLVSLPQKPVGFLCFGEVPREIETVYRIKPEECPRFIQTFEKILNHIDESKLIEDKKTKQQHYGALIGKFGTFKEAKDWLEINKRAQQEHENKKNM